MKCLCGAMKTGQKPTTDGQVYMNGGRKMVAWLGSKIYHADGGDCIPIYGCEVRLRVLDLVSWPIDQDEELNAIIENAVESLRQDCLANHDTLKGVRFAPAPPAIR